MGDEVVAQDEADAHYVGPPPARFTGCRRRTDVYPQAFDVYQRDPVPS